MLNSRPSFNPVSNTDFRGVKRSIEKGRNKQSNYDYIIILHAFAADKQEPMQKPSVEAASSCFFGKITSFSSPIPREKQETQNRFALERCI
jgi:hypothetical protein